MSWSDDPVRDFERYDAEMQRKQDLYDMGCVTCAWCKEPIRETDDPWCYELYYNEPLHPDCLRDMFRTMRKRFENRPMLADLFDLMEDAYEEKCEIRTPTPETGDY